MTPRDEDLTPDELEEIGALLVAERPRPSQGFAAMLDERVASGFARPAAARPRRTWRDLLQPPLLGAGVVTLAVALAAVVVVLDTGGGRPSGHAVSAPAVEQGATTGSSAALTDQASTPVPQRDALVKRAPGFAAVPQASSGSAGAAQLRPFQPEALSTRKVERSSSVDLGTPADRVDDVAQGVLGVAARFGGIVDRSTVSSGAQGGDAEFSLRIPAAQLQPALAALSQLPHAHVLSRTDDAVDVNQTYVSIRRRLADAQAARDGVLRALHAAQTEQETLRLQARLDGLERTIAATERAQRGLDRQIGYSQVAVAVHADGGTADGGGTGFTPGRALHDAGRVLAVTAGVVVIAAAALVPLAVVLLCAWPLARALRRRRREQALDTP